MKVFSDYQVTVNMPYEAFETKLKRNGYMPNASAAKRLIGEGFKPTLW